VDALWVLTQQSTQSDWGSVQWILHQGGSLITHWPHKQSTIQDFHRLQHTSRNPRNILRHGPLPATSPLRNGHGGYDRRNHGHQQLRELGVVASRSRSMYWQQQWHVASILTTVHWLPKVLRRNGRHERWSDCKQENRPGPCSCSRYITCERAEITGMGLSFDALTRSSPSELGKLMAGWVGLALLHLFSNVQRFQQLTGSVPSELAKPTGFTDRLEPLLQQLDREYPFARSWLLSQRGLLQFRWECFFFAKDTLTELVYYSRTVLTSWSNSCAAISSSSRD
jgi:hypothetical protein